MENRRSRELHAAGRPKNARTRYDRKADWILTAAAAASPSGPPPRALLLLVLLPDAGSATTVPAVDAASGTAAAAACCCPCSCCTTTTCSSASEKQCDDEDASGPWELDAAAPGRRKLHRLFSLPCGVAAACACEGSGADSTDWQSASALSLAFLPFLPGRNKFLSHWLALPICARRTHYSKIEAAEAGPVITDCSVELELLSRLASRLFHRLTRLRSAPPALHRPCEEEELLTVLAGNS